MVLLVTDTSGKNGIVALTRAESNDDVRVIESSPLVGGTFSAQLVPQISVLLENQRLSKRDIDAFVVVSGPGSFTGLRVGLAAVKALAEILSKPIVPVSLLEVLALAAERDGKVLALLDAGRGELYAGEYNVANGTTRLLQEQILRRDQMLSRADGAQLSTSDPGLAEIARAAGVPHAGLTQITPEMIARLGWKKLLASETVAPEQLEANYIRRSDDIFSKPARSS